MPKVTRGLFDPRHPNVAWPEPNDDPNIPYVWGLGSYQVGNPNGEQNLISAPNVPSEAPSNTNPHPEHVSKLVISSLCVLGVYGLIEGFSEDPSASGTERTMNSLATGAMYATGIGFIAKKLLGD